LLACQTIYDTWDLTISVAYPVTLSLATDLATVSLHGALPVLLAGVLLKMGTYGLLRFCIAMSPLAALEMAPWMMALGAIIHGAKIGRAPSELQSLAYLVCRLLLEKKNNIVHVASLRVRLAFDT